jgi:hypothetical protein
MRGQGGGGCRAVGLSEEVLAGWRARQPFGKASQEPGGGGFRRWI